MMTVQRGCMSGSLRVSGGCLRDSRRRAFVGCLFDDVTRPLVLPAASSSSSAIWVVALFVLGGLSASAGSGYTDSFSLPGTESTTALNLLTDNFNTESTDTNQVVFAADDVTDPATKARIEKTLDTIAKGPHVERVDSPFARGRRRAPDLQGQDGRVRQRAHGRRAADRRRAEVRLRQADRHRRGRARRRPARSSWAAPGSSRPRSSRAAGRASSSASSPPPSCSRSPSARCGRRCCRCSRRCSRSAAG